MDFMRFCEDIIEPTYEMLVDMCNKGYIRDEHAIALMHQITNIDSCLVDNDNVHYDVIECITNNFLNELGGN